MSLLVVIAEMEESNKNVITLDIGGTIVKTRKSTLERSEVLKARLTRWHDGNGPLFIDDDPDEFKKVLYMLRFPDSPIHHQDRELLKRKFAYYQIPFPENQVIYGTMTHGEHRYLSYKYNIYNDATGRMEIMEESIDLSSTALDAYILHYAICDTVTPRDINHEIQRGILDNTKVGFEKHPDVKKIIKFHLSIGSLHKDILLYSMSVLMKYNIRKLRYYMTVCLDALCLRADLMYAESDHVLSDNLKCVLDFLAEMFQNNTPLPIIGVFNMAAHCADAHLTNYYVTGKELPDNHPLRPYIYLFSR